MHKFLFLLLIISSLGLKAQDCERIRSTAQELDEQRELLNTGDAHYNYGYFLTQQVIAQNNCIGDDSIYEFLNAYAAAADLGHMKAGTRLALINNYGLLNRPMNYQRAYDVAKVMVIQSARDNYENDWEEYGWMNTAVILDRAERLKIDTSTDPFIAAVFERIRGFDPPEIPESAPNSEKRIRHDFYMAKYTGFKDGLYGASIDAKSALDAASHLDWDDFYHYYATLVIEDKIGEWRPNAALELFMAMHVVKNISFRQSSRDYAVAFLNKHIDDYENEKEFSAALHKNSKLWLENFNQRSLSEYSSEQEMFLEIQNSEYVESKNGREGWKFLPKKERTALFNAAMEYENESLTDKEKFDIFKAMVMNGESRGYYGLGNAYRVGRGVSSNEEKAITYLEKAIASGTLVDKARFSLAYLYDKAEGFQDWDKAYALYSGLQDTDEFPIAIREWASMTYMGLGGSTKNQRAAIAAMERCADLGDKECQRYLEVMKGFEKNPSSYELGYVTVKPVKGYADVINLAEESMTFEYDISVADNDEDIEVQLFTQRNENVSSMHHFNFAASSGKIKDQGTYTAQIYPYSKGYRDFGFMSVALITDGNSGFLDNIPLAVYSLPEKEEN